MKSGLISTISALVLLIGGIAFLFASDTLLPLLVSDIPSSATWLGELIGASWLGVAALNWLSRGSVIGGVYGRPVVFANLALYFITATVLVRASFDAGAQRVSWAIAIPMIILAGVYGAVLVRGPFDRADG